MPDLDTMPAGREVEQLIERLEATSDRLYRADFLGRMYLADYVADVGTLIIACKAALKAVEG